MPRTLTLVTPQNVTPSNGAVMVLLDDDPVSLAPLREIFDALEMGDDVVVEQDSASAPSPLAADDATPEPRILFMPSCDTHVKTFAPMIHAQSNPIVMVRRHVQHGERKALEQEGIPFQIHEANSAAFREADVALLGTDWGMEERVFIHRCRRYRLPVACLQEAVNVDFHHPSHRMQWADYALVHGIQAVGDLHRKWYFLTGNPRFDSYRPAPPPPAPRVLINCNFTFGVGVDWGRAWVDQVIDAAGEAGLDFAVTVHPRDETDLTGLENVLPSNAYKVADQLAASTILVSRDSSLPYEALLLNRHAVYYDSFHESERTLREDASGLIHKCDTVPDLVNLLKSLADQPLPLDDVQDAASAYRFLFAATDGENHLRVERALAAIAAGHEEWQPQDYRAESYASALWNMTLQQIIRPKLRRIPIARGLWRVGKRLVGNT